METVWIKGSFTYDQFACLALERVGAKMPLPSKGGEVSVAALAAAGLVYIRGNPGCKGALRFLPGRGLRNASV
jgi:hypothetical protein